MQEQLPRLHELGFDVVYLPPIHPIGHTNRKGRNNTLVAGPDDPGSPYAIGSELGGHDAVEPDARDDRRRPRAVRGGGASSAWTSRSTSRSTRRPTTRG